MKSKFYLMRLKKYQMKFIISLMMV